jgi:ABC-type multidrug transport system fused ATPase/permease subunit
MWKFFEGLINPFPKESTLSQPPKTFIKFILHYTKGIWRYLIIVSIASALVAIGEALFFYYMGQFVDILNSSTPENLWANHSQTFIFFAILVLFLLPVLSLVHHLVLNQTVRSNSAMQIRYRIHRYLLRQSVSFFANDYAGRVSQKVMQTSMALRDSVIKFTSVIVHMLVYFFTMIWMLADCNIYLVLVMLIWLVLYVLIMHHFIPQLRKQSSVSAEKRSSMVGRIVDSYANIQTVKLFSRNNHEDKYAKISMRESLKADYKLMRLVTKFDFYVQTINYIFIASLVATAVFLWTNGLVLVGAIALAFGLSIRINNLSQWVMWEVGLLFDNIGTVINGMETISQDILVKDSQKPVQIDKIKGDIVFNNVVFGYNESANVFNGLNLNIKSGEKVGIVGHSGGGKSTLVNLLLRFYDVNSGSITLDGIDIREYKQDDLRKVIAMVTQDTSLLHRSVRENILYGATENLNDYDKETLLLKEAATQANALDFIELLSDSSGNIGFDTQVGERGVRLSGGQRQRIAIARVILKNAPILILDEATSALDSEVESAVKENLDNLMHNRTVIAIAHRLSTIAAMDRLIVLKDGKIVEEGTHDQLLELKGIYASLWQKQTDGFIGK